MTEVTMNNTQTSTGDTLEERLKGWDREKKGLISDLQAERDRRHAMEKELEEIRQALNSAAKEPEVNDPQSEVNRLAQSPKEYIRNEVSPIVDSRVQSIEKKLFEMEQERQSERAYAWLAKKEKKDVDDIKGSELEQELLRISKERNLFPMGVENGTRAAYEIYQLEKLRKQEDESKRDQTIANNATHSVRGSSDSGKRSFLRSDIARMNRNEFEANREAILEAQRNGLILDK